MPPNESPVSPRGHRLVDGDATPTVVWIRGGHDAATCVHLSVTLAQAVGLDDADIVVDLSGVTFMDASTIGALVGARNSLRVHSRGLSVRAPSPRARRLLDLCGLAQLIDEQQAPVQPPPVTALGSWVDVPVRDRRPYWAPIAPEPPSPERVCVMARPCVEPAGLIQQRRAPL